jgi:hypothetical protein
MKASVSLLRIPPIDLSFGHLALASDLDIADGDGTAPIGAEGGTVSETSVLDRMNTVDAVGNKSQWTKQAICPGGDQGCAA